MSRIGLTFCLAIGALIGGASANGISQCVDPAE